MKGNRQTGTDAQGSHWEGTDERREERRELTIPHLGASKRHIHAGWHAEAGLPGRRENNTTKEFALLASSAGDRNRPQGRGRNAGGNGEERLKLQRVGELGIIHKLIVAEQRDSISVTRAHLLALITGCAARPEENESGIKMRLHDSGEQGVNLEALSHILDASQLTLSWIEDEMEMLLPQEKRTAEQQAKLEECWNRHDAVAGLIGSLTGKLSDPELQACVHGHGMAFDLQARPQRDQRLSACELREAWNQLEGPIRKAGSEKKSTGAPKLLN